jgi:putative hydrolase of the HAD superfamily
MIDAILWDFGGVITSSPFEAFNRYEKERGLPLDCIRGLNAVNPDTNAWARFERSEVSAQEFDDIFLTEARAAGYEIPGRDVIACLSGDVRPQMVAALKKCAEHFKVGCITNNVSAGEGPGMASSTDKAAQVQAAMETFEVIIESSKVGLRKPDPEIYKLACRELGVSPENAVYLDDLGINCKPAHALGMKAIKVVKPDDALRELEAATGLTFD